MLFAICISSLVRCPVKVFDPFFHHVFVFLLLSFKSSLYILDNIPLSDMFFANIFSQSVAYLLILLTSFKEQKFLIVINSSLSIISFMDHVLGVVSKSASPYP